MRDDHSDEFSRLFKTGGPQCAACGKGVASQSQLKRHFEAEGPFHKEECAVCHAEVSSWHDHLSHVRDHHGDVWVWPCGLCGLNSFQSNEARLDHRKFCKNFTALKALPPAPEGRVICTVCQAPVNKSANKV